MILVHSRAAVHIGSGEGSYLRLIDFVSFNSRLESNEEEKNNLERSAPTQCRETPSSASVASADFRQVDMLDVWYKFVNF